MSQLSFTVINRRWRCRRAPPWPGSGFGIAWASGAISATYANYADLSFGYDANGNDIDLYAVKVGEMVDIGARAEYARLGKFSPGEIVTWNRIAPGGRIKVRIRRSQLLSDEAIVTALAHEMHEINTLRVLFAESGGALPAEQLFQLISRNARHPNGTIGGILHQEAQAVERALLAKMRGE